MYETIFPSNWNLTRPAADNKAIKKFWDIPWKSWRPEQKIVFIYFWTLYMTKKRAA
jgi:hypothetical protein